MLSQNNGIEVERGIYDTKPVAQAADRYIYKNSGYEIKQSIDKNLLNYIMIVRLMVISTIL